MTDNRYTFLTARSGEKVPAIVLPSGTTLPLHSTVDPKREAIRLVSTITDNTGFVIFLGLGGGFAPEAALLYCAAKVAVIDFDNDSISSLFAAIDYSNLLKNGRFSLLIDHSAEEIKKFILEQYKPALYGGIKIIPLRGRIEQDKAKFDTAAAAIQQAIESTASDYSVQAHFGIRWFSNIIRNLRNAETQTENFTVKSGGSAIKKAAIIAAGPSLDQQIPAIYEYKSRQDFIISSDTALPVLLHHGIEPDAVVSIDCQHISYYHFMSCRFNRDSQGTAQKIPLFLDIASPPVLPRFSSSPIFFSSEHPLAQYISRYWRRLPVLDTKGGNVTYACLSLAENLGIQHITLFGADFAYVRSSSYARGTYIYPFFEKKQTRLSPLEALFSSFLYRSSFIPPENESENYRKKNYYETDTLRFYRKKLEEKASMMNAQIFAAGGQGAPIFFNKKQRADREQKTISNEQRTAGGKSLAVSSEQFLQQYYNDITALPASGNADYLPGLGEKDNQVFTTLLPLAAAIKYRNPHLKTNDLIEETKRRGATEIEQVLAAIVKT
jgi:hypothetical protein